jgi:hypothetical protein
MRRTDEPANYRPRVVNVDVGDGILATHADVATPLNTKPELDAAIPAVVA